MPKKGKKSMRNQPELYDEVKRSYSVSLTPTGVEQLDLLAQKKGLKRSELVEQIARGIISIS